MTVLREIEEFLKANRMVASRFGKLALGDAALVMDLRLGRELRQSTIDKIRDFMAGYPEEAAATALRIKQRQERRRAARACPRVDGPPPPRLNRPTGEDLLEELRHAAAAANVSLRQFVVPLAGSRVDNFLTQLGNARRPLSATVERVRALISGLPIPEARTSGFAGHDGHHSRLVRAENCESMAVRETKQALGHRAHEERRPGETLADTIRRIGREIDEEERNAVEDRRERELIELASPAALIRRAQRDWPEQSTKVAALAAQFGIAKGEAWSRVIAAGIESLAQTGDSR